MAYINAGMKVWVTYPAVADGEPRCVDEEARYETGAPDGWRHVDRGISLSEGRVRAGGHGGSGQREDREELHLVCCYPDPPKNSKV